MRGKAQNSSKRRRVHRITPAYAGKSFSIDNFFLCFKDHPRLCGEKLSLDLDPDKIAGITPAYAGKSRGERTLQNNRRDHPRLCGEKANLFGVTTDYLGSPPPMRGKENS